MGKWVKKLGWILSLILLLVTNALAIDVRTVVPVNPGGSVEPGVASNTIRAEDMAEQPQALPPSIKQEKPQANKLGSEAEKIKFKLTKITLEGNHVFSAEELDKVYENKIGTEISVAELQNIVQDVTNYYRNHGYILSRAILPPQRVQNGAVKIRVIEGYIDQVNVIGAPKGAQPLLKAYGDRIRASRPLQLKVLEHYLRVANSIPGMQVKAVLEPSKTEVGASDLNLSADQQTVNASLSYDNYGTLYMGPLQVSATTALNSIFLPGDSTRFAYTTTTIPEQLQYQDAAYLVPLGSNGLTMTVEANGSKTLPGLTLAPLNIKGRSENYYLNFSYPYLRSRDRNLTFNGGFNYSDSRTLSFFTPLYTDHLRPIKIGGSYDFADRFKGTNLIALNLEKGLNILGASNDPNSTATSRFGADGIYSKLTLQLLRLQQIYGRYSALFIVNGQYSLNPLLASTQFSFGGPMLGRGYDPAQIIGDRGAAGGIELRADFAPGWFLLNSFQPYVFYDAGIIWNIKRIVGVPKEQSATSTGFGSRFTFTKYLSGNLIWAQPLTAKVASQEVLGRGKLPRILFSVIASG